jgi:membrane protease YdiL (CAAX protease family)
MTIGMGAGPVRRTARAVEFVALFVASPLAMALALPPDALFPALFAVTAVAAALLARTPGFAWGELARGRVDWRLVWMAAAATAFVAGGLVWILAPGQALALPRARPGLWLTILALYPVLSALPQELVFRPLFFRRYGTLFPSTGAALVANGAVFALAHLMFWNWVAPVLTFAGGLIFAQAYLARGFPTAVVLHAVCGGIVFTSGLGLYFYHGAVSG